MDQSAALLCEPGQALLLDCRDHATQLVPFDPATAGLALLVMDTRAEHALVDGQYGERRASCEAAAAELAVPSLREVSPEGLGDTLERLSNDLLGRRARHIVTEIERVRQAAKALRDSDFETVGTLFAASHASMRDDFEISSPELDLVVTTALEAGATGARMTGGGFGGSAISLVPEERVSAVVRAIDTAFAASAFGAPAHLLATPSAAADVVA
jgi:galactokinase